MLPLLHLVRLNRTVKNISTGSLLVDINRRYIRNFFLFAFGLSFCRQIFGDIIICHSQKASLDKEFLHTACLINGTLNKVDGENGVVQYYYYDYYQWLSIFLLLEAILFYFPYHLWMAWCGREIAALVINDNWNPKAVHLISTYIEENNTRLFWKVLLLETVYTLHLVAQVPWINWFLNNGLLRGMMYRQSFRDMLWTLFPPNGTCYLDYYSGGSGLNTGRFLCLLPLNVVYRPVFTILLLLMAVMSIFHGMILSWHLLQGLKHGRAMNRRWAYRIAGENTQGRHLWLLEKARLRKPSTILADT